MGRHNRRLRTARRRASGLRRFRPLTVMLSVVVVLITAWTLISPASTLEKKEALKQGGIDVKTEEVNSGSTDQTQTSEKTTEKKDEKTSSDKDSKKESADPKKDEDSDKDSKKESASEDKKSSDKKADDKKADDKKDGKKDDKKDSDDKDDEKFADGELKHTGEDYDVKVAYKKEAKIPEDAKVSVKEIEKKDDEKKYEKYYDEALKAVKEEPGSEKVKDFTFARFYDITLSADGKEIEPKDAVKVTISYDEDKALEAKESDHIRVLHFTEDEKTDELKAEVLETKDFDATVRSEKLDELSFDADEFSVYAVVYVDELKTELLTASGDKYEVTVTYDEDAKIPDDAELKVKEIDKSSDKFKSVCEKAADELGDKLENVPAHPTMFDISIWHDGKEIEPAEGSSVHVKIKLKKEAVSGVYSDEDSPILVNDEPLTDDNCKIEQELQVIHDVEDGKMDFVDVEEASDRKDTVGEFDTSSFSNWLLYLDDEFENDEIYITVGDSLTLRPYGQWYWKKDAEPGELQSWQWLFPSDNYNTTQGSQTVPTNYSGGTATYYGITQAKTKDNKYTFAGNAKFDRELQESYWFYHADNLNQPGEFNIYVGTADGTIVKTITVHVQEGQQSQTPGTVQGLSNIKVNLFDYDNGGVLDEGWENGQKNKNLANHVFNNTVNINHTLKFLSSGSGNTNNGAGLNDYTNQSPHQGLVDSKLGNDNMPKLARSFDNSQSSLGYLFDTSATWGSTGNAVQAYPNVGGLFQQDNDGYYYYNSNKNYAYYDADQNEMILYEHTYTQVTDGSSGPNAKPIGFFPFHPYNSTEDLYVNQNKNLNHHLGMSMEVDFSLPRSKTLNNGEHIRYEFSGDDDLWVYVDDDLVLDIGGIHQPVSGYIDFTDGKVYVYNVNNGQPQEVASVKNLVPGQKYTLRMFYLERGGCDSNLSVRFNLPLTPTASLNVAKYDKSQSPVAPLAGVKFGVYADSDCTDLVEEYTSNSDGLIEIKDLTIESTDVRYYLKETKELNGYKKDETVYTLVPKLVAGQTDKYYFELQDSSGNAVQTIGQEPAYPVIYNDKYKPIELSVEKKWQDQSGNDITPLDDFSATFELHRLRSYQTPAEVVTGSEETLRIRHVANDAGWGTSGEQVYKYLRGRTVTINYDYHGTTSTQNKRQYRYSTNNGSSWNYSANLSDTGSFTVQIPNSGQYLIEFYDTNNTVTWNIDDGASPGTIVTDEDDTSFSCELITLSNGVTSGTFDSGLYTGTENDGKFPTQEKIGDIVYSYKYYITEKSKTPADSEVVYVNGDGEVVQNPSSLKTDQDSTQTIINEVPVGNLKVTKELLGDVTGNEDKTYKVTIKNSNGKYLQSDKKSFGDDPVEFEVSVSTPLEITGLLVDTYTVTEKTDAGDVEIAGFMWNDQESITQGEVTLEPDQTGTVELKNYYNEEYTPQPSDTNEYTDLNVDKDWVKADGSTTPAESDQIKVKIRVKSAEAYVPVKWDLYNGDQEEQNAQLNPLSGIYYVAPGSDVSFTINRAANADREHRFLRQNCSVPLYTDNGTPITFKHKVPSRRTESTGGLGPNTPVTYTARNVQASALVEYKLQPYLSDGVWVEDSNPSEQGKWHLDVAVNGSKYDTLEAMRQALIRDKQDSELTIEDLVYTMDKNGINLVAGETTCSIRPNADGTVMDQNTWTATLKDLPTFLKVEESGVTKYRVYDYEIVEIEVNGDKVVDGHTDDYQVTTEQNGSTTKITNTEIKSFDLGIEKADKDNHNKKLGGAEFKLYLVDEETVPGDQVKHKDNNVYGTATTGDGGTATLTGIAPGYYEVKETGLPAGYVLTGEDAFYIRVSAAGVELLKKDMTKAPKDWTSVNKDDGIVYSFAEASGNNPATAYVENTPGTPLPHTGGAGTGLFTILGLLLIGLAGLSLLIKNRKSSAN